MKKIVTLSIGLLITVAVSIGLFVLGNQMNFFNYEASSETFTGVLSEVACSTKEETVKTFLKNELTGATAQPVYERYEKLGNLTEADIEELGLEENVTSAEDVVVFYVCDDVPRSINMYLLNIEDMYHYYVLRPKNGEALTNSYLASVIDGAKYVNCTSTTTLNFRVVSSELTLDTTYLQTFKFSEDIAHLNQEIPGMMVEAYIKETDESLLVYMENPLNPDGTFYTIDEINRQLYGYGYYLDLQVSKGNQQVSVETLKKMEELTDFIFLLDIDASYFVKTPYGFSMPNEKYREVYKMMLGDIEYAEFEEDLDKYRVYFHSEYYVSEGRLSATKTVLTMTTDEGVFTFTIMTSYTDFGTTQVVIPGRGEE